MQRIHTDALVLRSVDFGESDRILHLLIPESGRITVMAKGARRSVRRFAGTLDLFNHLRVQVVVPRRGSMARLDQARLRASFDRLRTDPIRFGLGCYLLELFDRMAPDGGNRDDMRRLFSFALDALRTISDLAPDDRLRTLIELRALDALGLRPQFGCCVRCGAATDRAEQVDFHVGDGGTLCGACAVRQEGLLRVHLGTVRALEQGLRFDIGRLDRLVLGRATLDEARELVRRFQLFHVGIELRSERFLDRILRDPAPPPP